MKTHLNKNAIRQSCESILHLSKTTRPGNTFPKKYPHRLRIIPQIESRQLAGMQRGSLLETVHLERFTEVLKLKKSGSLMTYISKENNQRERLQDLASSHLLTAHKLAAHKLAL